MVLPDSVKRIRLRVFFLNGDCGIRFNSCSKARGLSSESGGLSQNSPGTIVKPLACFEYGLDLRPLWSWLKFHYDGIHIYVLRVEQYIYIELLKGLRTHMPIYGLKRLLKDFGEEYLVLEYNHLFVSDTIREEIWLFQGKNDTELIEEILEASVAFSILDADADRPFHTYSGGQQAILACLLVIAAIRTAKRQGVKLLLHNVIDSISEENRSILYERFQEIRETNRLDLYYTLNGGIEKIAC